MYGGSLLREPRPNSISRNLGGDDASGPSSLEELSSSSLPLPLLEKGRSTEECQELTVLTSLSFEIVLYRLCRPNGLGGAQDVALDGGEDAGDSDRPSGGSNLEHASSPASWVDAVP